MIEAAAAVQVTFVTRDGPVVNDATIADALAVGLDAVADLMGNGISGPLPGTDLRRSSRVCTGWLRRPTWLSQRAGGANYEMFNQEPGLAGKTTFVLFGKCDPLCGSHGVERDDLIVFNY